MCSFCKNVQAKTEIAKEVKDTLTKSMTSFGFMIIETLVRRSSNNDHNCLISGVHLLLPATRLTCYILSFQVICLCWECDLCHGARVRSSR